MATHRDLAASLLINSGFAEARKILEFRGLS